MDDYDRGTYCLRPNLLDQKLVYTFFTSSFWQECRAGLIGLSHFERTFASSLLASRSVGNKSAHGNNHYRDVGMLTWNEHNRLSSTLIIAPALSNSPQ